MLKPTVSYSDICSYTLTIHVLVKWINNYFSDVSGPGNYTQGPGMHHTDVAGN